MNTVLPLTMLAIFGYVAWTAGEFPLFLLVFGTPLLIFGLLLLAGSYLELRDEYIRDKAKAHALSPSLDEGTMRGFSKRRAQQLLDREEEIRSRTDEALSPGSSVKLWLYRRWGGAEAINYLLADLRELALAKRYIGRGGDYQDNHRAEIEAAELLKLRKELAQRYGLSPFEQRALECDLSEIVEVELERDERGDHRRDGRGRQLPRGRGGGRQQRRRRRKQ